MKHIKGISDFKVNEEVNFKKLWSDYKGYLIAIGLIAGISNYRDIKTTMGVDFRDDEISNIINDIKYRPEGDKRVLVNNIKKDLIKHIENIDMSESRKDKVIKDINDIKISILPKRYMNALRDKDLDAIGVHFPYVNYENGKIESAIVLNGDFFNYNIFSDNDKRLQRATIIHELWHMIDNSLAKTDKDKFLRYSDIIDLYKLLDKDIVTRTPAGEKKLERKLDKFLGLRKKFNKNNVTDTRKKEILKEYIMGNIDYMSSPSEVYARFHGLKQWLVDNGYMKSTNDNIKKEYLLKILETESLIDDTNNQRLDFFELIFFMNIDIDDVNSLDDEETIKYMNSLVTNFRDFDKTKRDA